MTRTGIEPRMNTDKHGWPSASREVTTRLRPSVLKSVSIRVHPWLTLFFLSAFALSAQTKKLGEAATLEGVEVKGDAVAGGRVTAVVKVNLEKNFHVHSNKPSQPEFIATILTLSEAKGAKAGTVVYPEGKSHKVEGLPKPLSVYEDHFELSIPIGLNAAAKFPLTIPAKLTYQACQGAQCYRPFDLKFDIVIGDNK